MRTTDFDPDHIWTLVDPSKVAQEIREAWGDELAAALDLGHDLLDDQLHEDIDVLTRRPKGTHLGEIVSWVGDSLPARWLMRYDYEFCWRLRATLQTIWLRLCHPGYDGIPYLIRCPADYLVLHVMVEEAASAVEMTSKPINEAEIEEFVYELADEDDETLAILFSDTIHPSPSESWHPDNWFTIPKEWVGVLEYTITPMPRRRGTAGRGFRNRIFLEAARIGATLEEELENLATASPDASRPTPGPRCGRSVGVRSP